MGFDPIPEDYEGLTCRDCFVVFSATSTCGPPLLCDFCYQRRIRELFADECGHHVFPVPGDAVTCGMRFDLPKDERGHEWTSLGIDVRHFDDGYLLEAEVFACMVCGRDKMKRPYVPRVTVDEAALDALIALAGEAGRDAVKALNPKRVKRG